MSDTPLPTLAPMVSPLLEADPNSVNDLIAERINQIMNKPPFDITVDGDDSDIAVLVAYHRRERARFLLEAQAKTAGPRSGARKKAPGSVAEALVANADLI